MAGKTVATVRHEKYGIEVPVRLTKDFEFVAEFNGELFSSKDGNELKSRLWKVIDEVGCLEWKPIIKVDYIEELHGLNIQNRRISESQYDHVQITIQRFYVAKRQDNSWVAVQWETHEENRKRDSRPAWFRITDIPCTSIGWQNGASRILPYTEELWLGLLNITSIIAAIRERLKDIVETNEGVETLIAIGSKFALPSLIGQPTE